MFCAVMSPMIILLIDTFFQTAATSKFDKLFEDLEDDIRDLLILGFNSKSNDFPLMKNEIIPYLVQSDKELNGCIKKFGNYMMVKTEKFQFLDIANFLAEGTALLIAAHSNIRHKKD